MTVSGESPMAGWLMSWKIQSKKRMMTGGTPMTQETINVVVIFGHETAMIIMIWAFVAWINGSTSPLPMKR